MNKTQKSSPIRQQNIAKTVKTGGAKTSEDLNHLFFAATFICDILFANSRNKEEAENLGSIFIKKCCQRTEKSVKILTN